MLNILYEFKRSIRLALPLIASEIIYMLSGFISTFMVAHLGKEQLAANALVWEIYIAVILFFIGILCSVGIIISQSFGAKDRHSIGVCFKQGLIAAIIFTPIMMLIMWLAPVILVWTKQDPIIIKLAKPFFQSLILPMLPLGTMVVIEQFLVGINKARIVTLMSILIVPIQIFFYYVFLFGKFGFPELGLAGMGYGLTISYSIATILGFCYINFSKHLKEYYLFRRWWIVNKKFLFELISVGLPLGLMFGVELTLFVVVAIMMGVLGTTTLAAYKITDQYLMLALAFIFAMTQTITMRIGNEVGGNNRSALKLAAMVNMGIGLGFTLLFSVFYICFHGLAISLDIDIYDPHLQELAKEASLFLSISGILILASCLRLIALGALRGLKDTKFSMFISIFGSWCISFPCAYLLAFKFKFGGAGILWGIALGTFITGLMFIIRFNSLVKRIDLISLVTKAEK